MRAHFSCSNPRLKPFGFLFVFAAFFLLSACVDNPSKEDRLACIELTSYEFPRLPECATTESCFSEADKAFRVTDSVFRHEVQAEVFSAKASISRAWLFLNNARSGMKRINSICKSNEGFSGIPSEANEINANLRAMASEIDSFGNSAAKAILLEASFLESQDINILIQEPIFDDYALLNQSIVDFAQGNKSGSTYASVFLSEAAKFKEISSKIGASKSAQESNAFTLFSGTSSKIVSAAKVKEKDFPLLSFLPLFNSASRIFGESFSLSSSVALLKSAPYAKAFGSVGGILGSNGSAASAFFGMMQGSALHTLALSQANLERSAEAKKSLEASNARLESISKVYGSGLPELLFGLDSNSQRKQKTETLLFDFPSFKASVENEVQLAYAELRFAEEADFLKSSTLGKISNLIAEASERAKRVSEALGFAESQAKEISGLCIVEIMRIKGKISGEEFSPSSPVAASMKSRLLSKMENIGPAIGFQQCSEILKLHFAIVSELDSSAFGSAYERRIEDCFSRAEKLLGFDQSHEISSQLDSLKRLPKPHDNPDLVLNSCISVEKRLGAIALDFAQIKKINSLFSDASKKVSELEKIPRAFPGLPSGKKAVSLLADYREIGKDFSGGSLSPEVFSIGESGLENIASALDAFNTGCEALLPVLAQEAAKENITLEIVWQNPEDENSGLLARISISNPEEEINAKFGTTLKLDSRFGQKVFSTGNVSFSPAGDETSVEFFPLMRGLNSIVLDLNALLHGSKNFGPQGLGGDAIAQGKNFGLDAASLLDHNFVGPDMNLAGTGKDTVPTSSEGNGESIVKDAAQESALAALEIASELNSVSESLAKKVSLLESNFSDLTKGELEEVYVYSPITQGGLKEMAKLLGEAEKQKSLEEKLLGLVSSGDYNAAIKAFEKSGAKQFLEKAKAADLEAGAAISGLKENSASSYGVASSLASNAGNSNVNAEAKLVSSKLEMQRSNYLRSMLSSQQAQKLLSSGEAKQGLAMLGSGDIPLAAYAVLAMIIGAAIYIYKKTEGGKEENPSFKIKEPEPEEA